MDYLAVKVFQQ